MKNLNSQTVLDLLEDVAEALVQTLRAGARTLRRLSWPALLLACVLIAFVLTILPLALFLFVCFMALKLVIGATVIGKQRERRHPDHQEHGQ